MNSRGILPRFVLGIIIAVIVILLLFFLASKLYNGLVEERDLEIAEKSLEKIILGFEKAKVDGEAEVAVYNPSEWIVIGFPYGSYLRPVECSRDSYCLCICSDPETWFYSDKNDYLEGCNEKSVCEDVDSDLIVAGRVIAIEDPPIKLKIVYDERGYEVSEGV
jgi:hypothetical protein